MKILHIISSLKVGGAERALCNLLTKIADQGFEHHVAYFHNGPCERIIQNLHIPTYPIQGLLFRYDFRAYYQLQKLISTIKPNLIHSSLWAANVMGRVLAYRNNIPIVCDLHGNCYDEGIIRNIFDYLTVPMATVTIAVADSVKDAYAQHIIGKLSQPAQHKAMQRLIVIKNGIDIKTLHTQAAQNPLSRKLYNIPEHAFVIGSVGRFEPIKSYDLLITSFALMHKKYNSKRPLVLCLVGDGSQKESLQALVKKYGLERAVIFTGARDDAYRFYQLFDCFALSSQSEGLSLALLEALCFGVPIVTTNRQPTHEAIMHRMHGFLVPPNNPQALADALIALYKNPELLHAIQAANRQLANQSFDIAIASNNYATIYRQTINLILKLNFDL